MVEDLAAAMLAMARSETMAGESPGPAQRRQVPCRREMFYGRSSCPCSISMTRRQRRLPECVGLAPLQPGSSEKVTRNALLAGAHRDRMRLLESSQRWSVRDVGARQCKRPRSIVTGAGIELRTVVRKGEQVFYEKHVEARPRSLHLRFGSG